MRLFIAVDVDTAVRSAVTGVVTELRASFEKLDRGLARTVKWVDPRHMHLTLHFLGEVPDRDVPRLTGALEAPIALAPFELEFGGVGAFPPAGAVRVVWMGCTRGGSEIANVHRQAGERLVGLPYQLESRPFRPHLTLGRFREPARRDVRPLLASIASAPVGTCLVSFVVLYQSQLAPAGPTYSVVARSRLES